MEKDPRVSILILNYNKPDDTINCISSFLNLNYSNYELIVIDNASTDASSSKIKERFPSITLLQTGKNIGYSGGNNFGIKYALENQSGYVLIVNNDTKLINPDFLNEMIDEIEKCSEVGIAGPRVLFPDNQVQPTILIAPTLYNFIKGSILTRFNKKKEKNYNIPQKISTLSGVCWLIRSEVFKSIGLLDDDYFMYAEELDYCFRARKAGWKVMYLPIDSTIHYHAPEDREKTYRRYLLARKNLVLFLRKHFGYWQAFILTTFFLFSNILKVFWYGLKRKDTDLYSISLLKSLLHEFIEVLSPFWKDFRR